MFSPSSLIKSFLQTFCMVLLSAFLISPVLGATEDYTVNPGAPLTDTLVTGNPGPNPGTYGSFVYSYRGVTPGRALVSDVWWWNIDGVNHSPMMGADSNGDMSGRELDITRSGGGKFAFQGLTLCNWTNNNGTMITATVTFQGYRGGSQIYVSAPVDLPQCSSGTTQITYTPPTAWSDIDELRIVINNMAHTFDPDWDDFQYVFSPTTTAITPTSGPTAGGTAVTITGTNFTGATAVTIGGAAATGVSVVNDTTITATTPAGAAGAQNVAVTTPGGTGTGTGLFTYSSTYTVTYNGNGSTGGTAPTDGSSPYASGATVTVLGNTGSLAKTGYTFAGWNTAANGSGTSYAAAATFAIAANTTLYAQWTINSYTVTFNSNGGTGGAMGAQSANYNVATALTTNGFTKTGYTFAGWNTVALGGGTAYADAASYPFTASVTLYAQWTINTYTLTYSAGANGSLTGATSQTVNYNASGSAVTAVPATGYHFVDWSDAQTANPRTDSNVAANVTVTANFAINTYTLSYNGNGNTGGSVPVDGSSPYNYNTSVTVAGNTGLLAKTGYTFAGWNTAANGSGTAYAAAATFAIAANTTLYAQWLGIVNATAASSVTPSGFTANWGSVAGATGYRLDVATDSGFTGFVSGYNSLDVGNVTSLSISGLAPGTSYFYRLRAYSASLTAANSNSISLTTQTGRVSGIVVDPGAPATLYAAVDGGGVFTSSNSGASWSATTGQPGSNRVQKLLLVAGSPTTLYAATYGSGIFFSINSGTSWSACTGQPSNLNVLALTGDASGRLYAGTEGGIFTSTNSCSSWSPVNGGLTVDATKPALTIVIDPNSASTLYAGFDGDGIYKSSNSGTTWTPATTQPANLRVKALVIQPGDGSKLYAATYGGGTFKSADSGANWSACATQPANLNLLSLVMDAAGKLYAGSETGVFVSSDACATWTAMNSGLPN